MPDKFEKFIRRPRLLEMLGISNSALDDWQKHNIIPQSYVLNPGLSSREIVAWKLSEIEAWMASRPQRRAQPVTPKAYEGRRQQAAARKAASKKLTRPAE